VRASAHAGDDRGDLGGREAEAQGQLGQRTGFLAEELFQRRRPARRLRSALTAEVTLTPVTFRKDRIGVDGPVSAPSSNGTRAITPNGLVLASAKRARSGERS